MPQLLGIRSETPGGSQLSYVWTPGAGPDPVCLMRMQSYFDRPREPMGEAWFMGDERKMYTNLLDQPVQSFDVDELARPLEAIASGTSAFGPFREWQIWFHYLLPRIVPRSVEHSGRELQELLVTAFVTQYPSGLSSLPYPSFRRDALATLGSCIMDSSKWGKDGIQIDRVLWGPPFREGAGWGWWEASADLSSSLFFCLKYLDAEEIPRWMSSVFAIADPHWRAQILVWLVGSHRLLSGRADFLSEIEDDKPRVGWSWSHCLSGNYTGNYEKPVQSIPFLSTQNKDAFWRAASELITPALFSSWWSSIRTVDYVEAELAGIPASFEDLYLKKKLR